MVTGGSCGPRIWELAAWLGHGVCVLDPLLYSLGWRRNRLRVGGMYVGTGRGQACDEILSRGGLRGSGGEHKPTGDTDSLDS